MVEQFVRINKLFITAGKEKIYVYTSIQMTFLQYLVISKFCEELHSIFYKDYHL